jgi:Holliday junction resolvase
MGDRSERAFVRMFKDTEHWWAQRAAASGAATEADLPDVTFAHDGIAFAGEEKTTSEPYIYVDPEEYSQLEDYAQAYGMEPVLLGRFKRGSDGLPTGASSRAFYVWNPVDMERTDAGTLRGSPTDGEWAAKIAEPDGTAEGILPAELTSFRLYHGVKGELGAGITEPSANSFLQENV